MYPQWLEQLTLVESVFFVGIVLPGVLASALLWRERFRVSLSRADQARVALLLGVCGLSFLALVAALAVRLAPSHQDGVASGHDVAVVIQCERGDFTAMGADARHQSATAPRHPLFVGGWFTDTVAVGVPDFLVLKRSGVSHRGAPAARQQIRKIERRLAA